MSFDAYQSQSEHTGVCARCGRTMRVRRDGTLNSHKQGDRICPGSHRPPALTQAVNNTEDIRGTNEWWLLRCLEDAVRSIDDLVAKMSTDHDALSEAFRRKHNALARLDELRGESSEVLAEDTPMAAAVEKFLRQGGLSAEDHEELERAYKEAK